MSLLLDSHALVWWLSGNERLSSRARQAIENDEVFVSAASAYEIALKAARGKWPEAVPLVRSFATVCKTNDFVLLPIIAEHALAAAAIASEHRDPFDRLLAAQAQMENLAVISADRLMPALGCTVI